MKEKMTSGEIAKKAGISQKAVRLYDEKGLLKPSDYSEGNYRLYDQNSLLVLEKIIALKQVGFSLEEIRDNLTGSKNKNILETLQEQIDLMEAKRYELEKAITRIKAVITRSNGNPDWDDVADILKDMQLDQKKDEGHFFALDHTKGELDWFVKIYQDLNIKSGERILDLGCGFSKVWRNSWEEIPEDVQVDAYDLRGSWADDFEKYIQENKQKLAENTAINLYFEDLEQDDTWKHIGDEEKYSIILAHYVIDALKNPELFIKRASKVLKPGGFCSITTYGNVPRAHYNFWYDVFDKIGMDTKYLDDAMTRWEEKEKQCKDVMKKYFSSIKEVVLPSPFTFEDVDDICKDLQTCIPEHESFISANKDRLEKYFAEELSKGDVLIPHDGGFWRLKK